MRIKIFTILASFAMLSCSQSGIPVPEVVKHHPEYASFTAVQRARCNPVQLFNGQDLSGFSIISQEPEEYRVEEGAMHFSGRGTGYVATEKEYSNYYLHVCQRFGDANYGAPGSRMDAGICYHLGPEDKVWPESVECNIIEQGYGEVWFVPFATGDTPDNRIERYTNGYAHSFVNEDFGLPLGEWNTFEVITLGNRSWHYVNGNLVERTENLSRTVGRILLQMENCETYYKDVYLIPLI